MAFKLKKVTVNGIKKYRVVMNNKLYENCGIDTVDGELYRITDEDGTYIGKLSFQDIVMLLATGGINNEDYDIHPLYD